MSFQGWSAVQIECAIGSAWFALVFGVMLALRWMPRKRLSLGDVLYAGLIAFCLSWVFMPTVMPRPTHLPPSQGTSVSSSEP